MVVVGGELRTPEPRSSAKENFQMMSRVRPDLSRDY